MTKDPAWYQRVVEQRLAQRAPGGPVTPGQEAYRKRVARNRALLCDQGHELRPGPWGLQICETCTSISLARLKRGAS